MRLSRWAALAAAPAVLMTSLHAAPPAQAGKTYPNPTCLGTTVPLYSPAMWTTAQGTAAAVSAIEGAHAQNGFVTSDASYQTLPTWAYWTMFANGAAGAGCS